LPDDAARLFTSPEWRAAAEYQAGDYKNSAATLSSIDTADAEYNRGNALARAGQLQGAVAAYDRSLELDPANSDAKYNRGLVQRLIQERKSQEESGQNRKNDESTSKSGQQQAAGSQASGNQQGGGDSSSAAEAAQGRSDAAHSPENGTRNGQGRAGDRSSADETTASGDSDSGGADEGDRKNSSQQGSAEQGAQNKGGNADREAPSPQDVEKWASEQAAEQWLRRIPQDPGGLLRRKFLYQYQRLGVDQDGRYIGGQGDTEPW
jgi:Ca-activated chloride channel family protein